MNLSAPMKVKFHGVDPTKLKIQEYEINEDISDYLQLIKYLRSNFDMECVFTSDALPAGMLCMINNADIDCVGGKISQNDQIVFINSLHGG